eukprot:GHVU01038003.1.p2 GENE.GHVU01038003.1~~GHVU01038003.1.p2  ORF type:complete len:175 (-),score=14.39 GHVU01038003.1:649-1173(-)
MDLASLGGLPMMVTPPLGLLRASTPNTLSAVPAVAATSATALAVTASPTTPITNNSDAMAVESTSPVAASAALSHTTALDAVVNGTTCDAALSVSTILSTNVSTGVTSLVASTTSAMPNSPMRVAVVSPTSPPPLRHELMEPEDDALMGPADIDRSAFIGEPGYEADNGTPPSH